MILNLVTFLASVTTAAQISSLPSRQFGSKKYIECVHNIVYNINESFQKIWIKIGNDIPTGQQMGPVNMWVSQLDIVVYRNVHLRSRLHSSYNYKVLLPCHDTPQLLLLFPTLRRYVYLLLDSIVCS